MAQTGTSEGLEPATHAVPTASPPRSVFARTFRALRHSDYRYLLLGTFFSSMGQWVEQVTLGWLVYSLTGSSVLLGLVNGARSIPFLITGPLGGVVIDRFDRQKLMMGTQAFLMAMTTLLSAIILSGNVEVWHLFVFTLSTGVAWSLNQPVRNTLVASVVPREDLQNAVGLNAATFNLTRVVGPTIGGVLIAVLGAGGNFAVQSCLYVAVIVTISRMRVPARRSAAQSGSVLRNLQEGATWVWRNHSMRALMALALIPSVTAMPYMSLMPVFASDVLQVGPSGLGLMLAATGAGALVGALSVASGLRTQRREALQFLALGTMGASLILFSQMRDLAPAMLFLAIIGGCQMAYMNTNQAVLQMLIPDQLRGRVMAIYMLNIGLMPFGTFLAGLITSVVGAPTTVTGMGSICIAIAVIAALIMPPVASPAAESAD